MKALKQSIILYKLIIGILMIMLITQVSQGQYFGRNKPGYKKFKFDVVQTPHFEIYHYLKNDSMINEITQWSEKWYQMHQKIFRDTFKLKNPIILYSNHADFQQTNTVSGDIGNGTGGVTEGLKNRVIIPVASSLAQTDHVLGHELVHAFQYHMFTNSQHSKDFSTQNVPLWMIEGMAEYLSKGSVDPHTSMIMRDAVLNNDFPTLKKLSTESRYFPYTYGQAFWAMIAKTWGDAVIMPLLRNTAIFGFNHAADSLLKVNDVTLSGMWKSATELYYSKFLKNRQDTVTGNKIISDRNAGKINVSPSISPDGKYIAFFSEKDLFTLDLYLADVSTGKILKKLSSVVRNSEIDDFDFIESSGTWSPDGKHFAFVVFSKGKNKLAVLNVRRGKITEEYEIPGVPSFSNPAWSPDGKKIAFSGMVDGINDLYIYSLSTGDVEKLTDDFVSDMHPSWSSDGKYIVFSKERVKPDAPEKNYAFDITILDVKNKTEKTIDVFRDSYNMNPVYSHDDRYIFFLSDADGFRNLFRYDTQEDKVERLTEYMTGVSGITEFSPALSIARNKDVLAYNYFYHDEYNIYTADNGQFRAKPIDNEYLDYTASTLPPVNVAVANKVDQTIYDLRGIKTFPADSAKEIPYKPKFKLDYISNNASIGVSTGLYRNNLGGSINMIFGDMVGNNQIYSSLSLNGEIYDFGGQVAYLNQGGKIKWGVAVSHIPYLTGGMYLTRDSITYNKERIPVDNFIIDYYRIFEDNASLFAQYPFSQTRRLESTVSTSWYYYRVDRFNNYYIPNGPQIGSNRRKMPAPPGFNFRQASLAYVEDNSFFGMTAPMQGHRARFQVERYFGDADIYTTLLDYRRYFFMKPVTLAFRFYNYSLYGAGAEKGQVPQLYLGNPWFVRGYENVLNQSGSNGIDVSSLVGSKIAVANAEVRIPFTGPERLALIKSKYLFTDINLFLDSGLAWGRDNQVQLGSNDAFVSTGTTRRQPIFSTGISLRVNVLGAMIVEPFFAFPLENGRFLKGSFGLNFIPGW